MEKLNTYYPTIVFRQMPLIDPKIITEIMGNSTKTHERVDFTHKDIFFPKSNKYIKLRLKFITEIASSFLTLYGFKHCKNKWYMDCIRHDLHDEKTNIVGPLCWHCENDNYSNLITVLFYLRKDKGVINGDLEYKDKNNQKQILEINSGMTVIMDGRVQHKPQDPYGSGKRELIAVSFRNY